MVQSHAVLLSILALACASAPPYQDPIAVEPVRPQAGQILETELVYVIADASASLESDFSAERALLESFVASMPDGDYTAGLVSFGGLETDELAPDTFDRSRLADSARHLSFLSESSPLERVLRNEVLPALSGGSERAAVIILSDGLTTDIQGRDASSSGLTAAASELVESRPGELCFHTIQIGSDPRGAALLGELAQTTPCGSSRSAATTYSAAGLEGLQRDVFFGEKALPAVAAAPRRDLDGDGVLDFEDRCPGTPRGAHVDERGCWLIKGLLFDSNSAEIAGRTTGLDEVVDVLEQNPDLRVRVEGHTDSAGTSAYNQQLSERRAERVRGYLVDKGIAPDRVEAVGRGEAHPLGPNDTREARAKNRRIEIALID